MNTHKTIYKRGQVVLVTVVFFVTLATILVLGTTAPVFEGVRTVSDISRSRDAYYWAEGAIEDVAARFKKGYVVPASVSVPIASTSVTVTVSDFPGIHQMSATGNASGDQRRVQASVVANTGIAFNYGLQVGTLGATLSNNSTVNGNIFTNGSVTGANGSVVNGSLLAVGSISSPNPSVSGQRQSGVTPIGMPEVDIAYWKAAANTNNDPYTGNLSYSGTSGTIGPRKVIGNVTLTNNGSLTVQGPLHITGDLLVDNNATFKLDNSFGSAGTVVIVEGKITLSNNAAVLATNATPKGYMLLVSIATGDAIEIDNNAGAQAYFYGYNGTVLLSNNAAALALIGQGITFSNNAVLNYDEGLAHPQFSTGPGGSFDVRDWKEVQ